ncbi:MAG: chemotaxis protein, partial [Paucimonas sp.]|nr:chemotaxis protein [Paucimonas sp.]
IGIEEVHRAISQMDEITQQNAALVEEAAAAAQSMQDQAQNLAQAVQVFKLTHGAVAAPGLASPRKPASLPRQVPQATKTMKRNKAVPPTPSSRRPAPAVKPTPSAATMRAGDNSGDWEEF